VTLIICFFAVRPAILIVAYVLPIKPEVSLPLISMVFYVASIFLAFYFTKSLYDNISAVFAAALLAANFPVILNSSAPNADITGLAAALLIQCLALRLLRQKSTNNWIFMGLLSGSLVLIRETVLMAVIAVCLLLIYKRMRRAFLFYSVAAFLIIIAWQTYTSLMFHMNYLTQFLHRSFFID
jgi:4-amino-4-deoxy-L-arabinose transferase-like glycosyltransferase